jgi:hypothetical protein
MTSWETMSSTFAVLCVSAGVAPMSGKGGRRREAPRRSFSADCSQAAQRATDGQGRRSGNAIPARVAALRSDQAIVDLIGSSRRER